MGYAIINVNGIYANAWSRHTNPPRPLAAGETVVECDWDAESERPVGVTMPTQPPAADWPAFRRTLLTSQAYQRIGGHNSATLALLPMLVSVGFLIDSDATKLVDFAAIWNAIAAIAEPTAEEITSLNALAVTHNIPFTLDSGGLL